MNDINEYINLSIRTETGSRFSSLKFGHIYWIPGLNTEPIDKDIYDNRFRLNLAFRREESIWFDAHFHYATEDIIRIFGQRDYSYLVTPLLDSYEHWDSEHMFLETDMRYCMKTHILNTFGAYASFLCEITDKILDGQNIKKQYSHHKELVYSFTDDGAYFALPPGEKGISGIPHKRISEELGKLVVAKDLTLSFSKQDSKIKMPNQCRTIYTFFLRHPEGVSKKELSRNAYIQELANLYERTSPPLSESKDYISVFQKLTKRHNRRSSNHLNHIIERCNTELNKISVDPLIIKQYILTTYKTKKITIPVTKRPELIDLSSIK